MTEAEIILWSRIRPRVWPLFRFRRQQPIGPYIADFACLLSRMVIEVDGATHGSGLERAHDRMRDAYMRARRWRVIRIFNDDVYKRLNETLDFIGRAAPPPLRSRKARSAPPP